MPVINFSFFESAFPFLQYFVWLIFVLIAIWGLRKREKIGDIRARGGLFLLGISLLLMAVLAFLPYFWKEAFAGGFRS